MSKVDSIEFSTSKDLQQISLDLRGIANQLRADVDAIEDDPIPDFGPKPEISVVLSARLGMKLFGNGGSPNNYWAVQVYVTDLGEERHIELVAIGESATVGIMSQGRIGRAVMSQSVKFRNRIADVLA